MCLHIYRRWILSLTYCDVISFWHPFAFFQPYASYKILSRSPITPTLLQIRNTKRFSADLLFDVVCTFSLIFRYFSGRNEHVQQKKLREPRRNDDGRNERIFFFVCNVSAFLTSRSYRTHIQTHTHNENAFWTIVFHQVLVICSIFIVLWLSVHFKFMTRIRQ